MSSLSDLFKNAVKLQRKGNYSEAIKLLERYVQAATGLDPQFVQAHYKIGILYNFAGRTEDAISAFRKLIDLEPGHIDGWNGLGSMLMQLDRIEEGAGCFEKALALNPDHVYSLLNYGRYLGISGRTREAEASFTRAVRNNPDLAITQQSLGLFYYRQGNYKLAENALRKSLRITPANLESRLALAEICSKNGKNIEAMVCYRQAIKLNPVNLQARLGLALTLAYINSSDAEIDDQRSAFQQGLISLNAMADRFLALGTTEKLDALQRTNFLLAYHGRDDREFQQGFADFQRSLLESALPQYFKKMERRYTGEGRLKVGFISEFFYRSTVGKYFCNWVIDLDKNKFETTVFSLARKPDQLSKKIEQACDFYHQQNFSLAALAKEVHEARLDVIIYPDLGMNPRTFAMASLRLAPLQCAAWGHPVTTGHDNIDVYLSVEAMEPPDAQNHYTEHLVLLPGIGTCYERPAVPETVARASLGLPESAILYLFPQSVFKIHPHNDELLLDILEREPRAVIVMFQSREEAIHQKFLDRLGKQFDRRNLSVTNRIRFLPRCSHQDYLRVNLACDVMLDSLYWSGGNTALDAIACALPLITLPGEFMRGRQSYAMLSMMGVTELIADSRQDYIRLALELGRDREHRARISQLIKQGSTKIFGQHQPLRELESFLLSGIKSG